MDLESQLAADLGSAAGGPVHNETTLPAGREGLREISMDDLQSFSLVESHGEGARAGGASTLGVADGFNVSMGSLEVFRLERMAESIRRLEDDNSVMAGMLAGALARIESLEFEAAALRLAIDELRSPDWTG